MKRIVIVGGVAGGATAAARLRRLDETAEITVFERTGYVSYANCGLPYYIGGVIEDGDELTLQTPEGFFERFRIDVRTHHEVTEIDREKKSVSVTNLKTGERFEKEYDTLLLAPGARPIIPNLPGFDLDCVFTLRTVEDTFKLHSFVESAEPKKASVIGGGFVGIELAENLMRRGVSVTLIDMQPQLLARLDGEMAAFVHQKIRSAGVKLLLGCAVNEIKNEGANANTNTNTNTNGASLLLSTGERLNADMVVAAIGVAPESTLARAAGLELGIRGSILVNDRMQTSDSSIYAVGDAVEVKNFVSGEPALVALAGPANKQARIAADNIAGLNSRYNGAQGTSVIKLFDTTVASTGLNEREAEAAGFDCEKIYLSPMNHAGYYPGGTVMTLKLLFDKRDMRILGAQIVGGEGVDKRIDVIATAMRAGLSADALAELELAYAPPYSSAKDPVNMAGFMADNIKSGRLKQFHFNEADALKKDGSITLLDVRTAGEYAGGHIEGFINIPVDELREHICELDRHKPVYVMCQSGLRSYIACNILRANGFDCSNLSGGYRLYAAALKDKLASTGAAPCGKEN